MNHLPLSLYIFIIWLYVISFQSFVASTGQSGLWLPTPLWKSFGLCTRYKPPEHEPIVTTCHMLLSCHWTPMASGFPSLSSVFNCVGDSAPVLTNGVPIHYSKDVLMVSSHAESLPHFEQSGSPFLQHSCSGNCCPTTSHSMRQRSSLACLSASMPRSLPYYL